MPAINPAGTNWVKFIHAGAHSVIGTDGDFSEPIALNKAGNVNLLIRWKDGTAGKVILRLYPDNTDADATAWAKGAYCGHADFAAMAAQDPHPGAVPCYQTIQMPVEAGSYNGIGRLEIYGYNGTDVRVIVSQSEL